MTPAGPDDAAAAAGRAEGGLALTQAFRAGLAERGIALGAEIGRGAASVVYRARDHRHARDVAVKLLDPSVTPRPDPSAFLQEVQLAAGLQHPHILPIYQSGVIEHTPFFVMPYVEGESLRHRLARGRLTVDEAIRIALQVAYALRYAHSRGVVHRDIKPENILLEDGDAMVADFGVAARLADPERGDHGLTVGTAAYISPEQASGEVLFDGRSDLYALACMLYEILAGTPPFTGGTFRATIARRFMGPPIPLRQRRPEVPEAVARVVERALAIDPADRFPSVADFVEALTSARGPGGDGERPAGRKPGRATLLGAAAVALAGAAMLGVQPWRGAERMDPRRVAVAALSNETGDSTEAPVGEMVASWITDRLAGVPGIDVVTSATVVPAQHDRHEAQSDVDDPERLRRLATETRAGTLVSGSYYRGEQGTVEFHVEITDANSGRLLRAFGPTSDRRDPPRAAALLGRAVASAVDSLLRHPGRSQAAAGVVSRGG
jgi:serine/threonine-protein kinase